VLRQQVVGNKRGHRLNGKPTAAAASAQPAFFTQQVADLGRKFSLLTFRNDSGSPKSSDA